MKTLDKDILQNNSQLKETPFCLPEGYMDSLKNELKAIPRLKTKKRPLFKVLSPYISLAAAFAMIVTIGGLLLKNTATNDFTSEDYILFSEDMTNIILDMSEDQYAEALTDDDIIEYLIYSGVEIEELY